jgi:peptidoglycan/LPS O-acetylase OafA/YrhL
VATAVGGAATVLSGRILRRREPGSGLSRPATDRPGLPYIPGLDGLRALGVLAVLLYHADVGWVKGGFLGVELFFVVSGFLITTLLLAELSERGRLNVREFWLRRARRLLPAAFALIIATLAASLLFLPGEVAGLRDDSLAGFGYISNWYLVIDDQSYFESLGRPSLLLHLWSLAVEEQFYIVWPLAMVLVLGRIRRWQAFSLIVIGAIGSAVLMAYLYDPLADPSRIYYGTDTRAGGLLIGAALAFVLEPGRLRARLERLPAPAVDLAGVAALAAVACAFWRVREFDSALYQGGFAAFGLVSALLIAAVVHPRSRLSGLVLSRQPLRWMGLRSYSIYLWHWPVFMLTRPGLDIQSDGIELLALRLVIVFVLAEITYRLVETPFRSGAVGRFFRWTLRPRGASLRTATAQWIAPSSAVCALILVLVLSVAAAQPPLPPAYLSVSRVTTTAWSDDPGAPRVPSAPTLRPAPTPPTPTKVATPVPTPSAAPATPTLSATQPPTSAPAPTTFAATPPPVPTAPPPPGRVFALGDSVMLGAAPQLTQYLGNVEVDAEVGRQAAGALEIISWRKQNAMLGDVVVVHIGNNGIVTPAQLEEVLRQLTDVPEVAVVNVKVPRDWEGVNNATLAQVVPAHPNAVLVDWHAASVAYSGMFYDDGIHLRPEGAAYYAQTIAAALAGH